MAAVKVAVSIHIVRGYLENNAMAVSEINPATGKVWSRDELFTQLRKTEAQLQSTADMLADKAIEVASISSPELDPFITWEQQLLKLRSRWNRHLEEWALATADTRELGTTLRGWWEQARNELSQPLLKS